MIDKEELKYWVAISCVNGVGPSCFLRLLRYFGSARNIWDADLSDLKKLNLQVNVLQNFLKLRESLNLEEMMEQLKSLGVEVLTIKSKSYPLKLKQIYDPPFVLYVRGMMKKEDELAIAVVGSRRMTPYGSQVTEKLVQSLVAHGLTIVSGLAFGVDIAAQKVALDAGGRVIAVLASGLDKFTPLSNSFLAERILAEGQGAIVSEYPLGVVPQRHFFPIRNRIISGLSLGTVVIEAAEKSGTVHTVRSALEQGREVFAVPGSIFNPLSAGCLELIQSGAKLVRTAQDILEELEVEVKAKKIEAQRVLPESQEEEALLEFLKDGPVHIDELVHKSGFSVSTVSSVLSLMEIKGLVKNMGKMEYRKVR